MNIMRKGNQRNNQSNRNQSFGFMNYDNSYKLFPEGKKKPRADNLKENMPGRADKLKENMPEFDSMPKENARVKLAKKRKASPKEVIQMFSYKNKKGGLEFSLKQIVIMSNRSYEEVKKLFEEYMRQNKH
jgi:hypothetical protein